MDVDAAGIAVHGSSVAGSSMIDPDTGDASAFKDEALTKGGESRHVSRDGALPELKQASTIPPVLHIPQQSRNFSPSSSRNSSLSGKSSSQRGQMERGGSSGSPSCSLVESSLRERSDPAGGRRVLVSASSGINLRAVGSPGSSSISSRRDRRDERGKAVPAFGRRGFGSEPRSSLSTRTSPRTSHSPDARRSSMSFEDFVAISNSDVSLLETSRLSSSGKRPRDRNALTVAVRVRPLIAREQGSRVVACDGGDGRMVVVNPVKFKASADAILATASAVSRANMATSDWLRPFDFDRVYWSIPGQAKGGEGDSLASEPATQQTIFEGLGKRIVDDVLNGFNCSCFAYGHTGSGKTYSMFGCSDDNSLPDDHEAIAAPPQGEAFGLVPRVCYSLLRRLQEGYTVNPPQEPGASSVGLSVQFIEIYNDKIRDLLNPGADSSAFRVREHPQTGPYVDNLVPVQVESWSQLRQLLTLGVSARAEAETLENIRSSRGHAILTLEAHTPAGFSRVQMVDLAGSEREVVAQGRHSDPGRRGRGRGGRGTGGAADGGRTLSQQLSLTQRLRETAQIKKALSNLGIIIKGLSRGDTPVGLPFRDSILTWLLKEALSGRAHTTMLATVSPSSNSYIETMSTLKYAERLKRANAHLTKDSGGSRMAKPSDGLKKEMKSLVEKLGADGIEAKRQVLYQTVSDPQQRIAKLTAKDFRRQRRLGGGSSLPRGGSRRPRDEDSTEQRRLSFPDSLSSQRFGWKPSTPSTPSRALGGNANDPAGESTAPWGSPINTPDDVSLASDPDEAHEVKEQSLGVETGTFDDGVAVSELSGVDTVDFGGSDVPAWGVGASQVVGCSDGAGRPDFLGDHDLKFYSESDKSNGSLDAGASASVSAQAGGASITTEGGDGDYDDGDDEGGDDGGGDCGGDGGDHRRNSSAPGEQRPDSWLASSESGDPPAWAGTSSSEKSDSPRSRRTEATANAAAQHASAAGQLEDETTAGFVPASGRGNRVAEISCTHVAGSDTPVAVSADTYLAGSSDTYVAGSSNTYIGGSAVTCFGDAPHTHVTDRWTDRRAGEAPALGRMSEGSFAGSAAWTGERHGGGVRAPDVHAGGSATPPTVGGVPEAERQCQPQAVGSAGVRRAESPGSSILAGGVDEGATDDGPSRRTTWGADETEDGPGMRGGQEERKHAGEGVAGRCARHDSAVSMAIPIREGDRADGRLSKTGRKSNSQRRADEGSDDSIQPEPLNPSIESGWGAAALAASGVFDTPNTSAELKESGDLSVNTGGADSFDGMGGQGEASARRHPGRGGEGRQAVAGCSGGGLPSDDSRMIPDLVRQVEELKTLNASLVEEVHRLQDELRRSKESEEEAWALGDDTAKEFQSRLASIQVDLQEQTARAREAERNARAADARAESVLGGGSDASRLLDEAHARLRKAERRVDGTEARGRDPAASVKDANALFDCTLASLEERGPLVEEIQSLLGESRRRAEEAQQRADRAEAKAAELEALASVARARLEGSQAALEEQETFAEKARRLLGEARRRAEEAEQRVDVAEAKEKKLEAGAKNARAQLEGLKVAQEEQAAGAEEARRLLEESRGRAKEAERRAAAAESSKAELEAWGKDAHAQLESTKAAFDQQAADAGEARRLLEEFRRCAKEAEQRAIAAGAQGKELEASARDLRAQLEGAQAALEEQVAGKEEVRRLLEESRKSTMEAEQRAAAVEAREAKVEASARDAPAALEGGSQATAAAAEEAERLLDESRTREAEQRAARTKAGEEELEARAKDACARLDVSQAALRDQVARTAEAERLLDEAREQAEEIQRRATRAEAREKELSALVDDASARLERSKVALTDQASRTAEAEQLLEAAREQAKEAERRAAAAETRETEVGARAEDARAQLERSKAALRHQVAMTEEAERKAHKTQAALEAAGGEVDAAVAASQRVAEQERQRAAEADARANRVAAKAKELASLVDEQESRLRKARAGLEEAETRADSAQVRERRAAGRVEELEGVLGEKDERLERLKQALQAEEAKAGKIAEDKKTTELRVAELQAEAKRHPRKLEAAKNEAKTSLDAMKAAAEVEMEQAAQQRNALIEERDRVLEQVEAERTEVLRLAAELSHLRSAMEQDATAAGEREAALKALLASETEASRAEQAEVEDLLSLISAAQDTRSGDGDDHEPAVISIHGARVAVETQRTKYEALRRRLQVSEKDNRALMEREGEAQAKLDQFALLKEERDFLLQEKDTLVCRLGNLEARQRSFQDREKQAKIREDEAGLARSNLEEELRRMKHRLALESELRAKESKEFADRLKEKDEQAAEQLRDTLKQVMEGVKSQAGHIRGTVSQLEDARDMATRGRDAATKELEDVKCLLEALKKDKSQAESNFEEQMKQSARERAALWLAVNKLDVLEAAKDAAIKELQKEGEDKARALKVLQAHNAGLTRELGQVDMSLMQALEDNGLTLDSVRLQNMPISRTLRRRSSVIGGNARGGLPPPSPELELEEVDDMHPAKAAVAARASASGKVRSAPRVGAIDGDFGRAESAIRLPRPQAQSRSVLKESASQADLGGNVKRDAAPGRVFSDRAPGHRERGRTYSASSFQADRWDPAITTIEREISELSERLDTSRRGKRLRLRGSQVSPPRTQEDNKRERLV